MVAKELTVNRERSAWGVTLIVVGLIFLGDRLGWGVGWNMGRLWPLIPIAIGLVHVVSGRGSEGVWLLFVGGLFLLHMNHIVRLSASWPLFIVAAGIGMLFARSQRRRREPAASEKPASAGGEEIHE